VAEQLIIICLLVAGASILPFIARRFNVPSAVLEILFGMFLFHTALHERPEWFEFLKDIGFIYLMFIAGMELDLRALLKNTKVFWYVAIPVLSLILTPAFFYLSGHSFFVGISLSMISAGITFPVLKEVGLVRRDLGRHIVGVTLAGEFISIIALTGLDIAHSYGVSFSLLLQVLKLAALLALATLTLRLIYVIAWWNPGHVRKVMESEDPVEEGIRLAITIVFVGALIAYGAGMEPIMGSFMAGVMFTFVFRNKSRFEEKINALGFGFFVPFFFMGVGADFDIGLLFSVRDIFLALLMAAIIFASNLPALFVKHFLGLSLREGFLMTLLLSAPLSMIVVAGTIGTKLGLIDGGVKNTLVLSALLASLIYPFFFRVLARRILSEKTDGSGV
jgi:Kef-type K+ transport system membrane component KefB